MSEIQSTGAAIDMFDVLHDSLDLDSTGSVVECKNGERYITMYSGGVKYIASEGELLAKIDEYAKAILGTTNALRLLGRH